MRDSFDPITVSPVKKLDKLQIVLEVTPGTPNTYSGIYTFHILNDAGQVIEPRTGDFIARAKTWTLTAAQKTALGNCTTVAAVLKLVQDYGLNKAQGALG